jgi:dimethylsulfone monooxygenase
MRKSDEIRAEMLHATNPLFNERKLKLGTFGSNLSGAQTVSSMEGVLKVDWPTASTVGAMADAMEFEAIVPVGRWRGFGGDTDFNGDSFESYTFAAGMAAQTKYPAVFATSHVSTVHPTMAAKQAATIDHISGGRFSLNVITGWYKAEFDAFGLAMPDHDARYDGAAEWIEIMRLLWQSEEPVTYEGKYYQVRNALLRPQPIQKPCPPVMCAGQSKKGRQFSAKYSDITFMVPENRSDPAALRAEIQQFRKSIREQSGRDIKLWSYTYIIQADTEEQAKKIHHHCVHEKGDWAGLSNVFEAMGLNNLSMPPEIKVKLKEDFIAGFGGVPLIGTKEQIVDGLKFFVDAGIDGLLLTWPSYVTGMRRFQKDTYPLLVQAGLR